jgi:predicted RNase H-like HicB family nuclease
LVVAPEPIHLIVRDTGEGFYATSPQAPGLAFGRPTLAELRAELQDVLAFHFNRPGPFQVLEHLERQYAVEGREMVTRIADDQRLDQRQEVAARLGRALTVPGQARSLLEGPTNRVGEVVYLCAVPSDRIGWLAGQLDPRGDAAVVALAIAEPFVFTVPIVSGDDTAQLAGVSIAERGYTPETTLGELVRDTPIVQPVTAPHPVAS